MTELASKVAQTLSMRRRGLGHDTGDSVLAGPIYTVPKLPPKCATCNRDPNAMNGATTECSHVECPHRGCAWSSGTGPAQWRPTKTVDSLAPLFDAIDDEEEEAEAEPALLGTTEETTP